MKGVQKHFIEVFRLLHRPAAQHDVEVPGVLDDMKSQLRNCKVYLPCIYLQ